jgi:hypothetical protein
VSLSYSNISYITDKTRILTANIDIAVRIK